MKHFLVASIVILMLLFDTSTALGGLIQGQFTGTVGFVDPTLIQNVNVGDPLRVSFLMDSDAQDLVPKRSSSGLYDVSSAMAQIGSFSVDLSAALELWTFNTAGDGDTISLRSYNVEFPFMIFPHNVGTVFFSLHDSTGDLLSSDAIPLLGTVFSIDGRSRMILTYCGLEKTCPAYISGPITELSITAVPEPSSLVLLAIAVVFFSTRTSFRVLVKATKGT